MSFDFRTRANQLASQKASQQQKDIQKRDRENEIARDLTQGLLVHYAGRMGDKFVGVEGNVATIKKPNAGVLNITVLGENAFSVKENGGKGGFRDQALHENMQKDQLNKNEMMDTIIEWLDEN